MNNNVFKPVRRAEVYYNDILAGVLLLNRGRYTFIYDLKYMYSSNPSIALDMPKSFLCARLGISRSDKFTMLVKLANHETIGAITVREGDT